MYPNPFFNLSNLLRISNHALKSTYIRLISSTLHQTQFSTIPNFPLSNSNSHISIWSSSTFHAHFSSSITTNITTSKGSQGFTDDHADHSDDEENGSSSTSSSRDMSQGLVGSIKDEKFVENIDTLMGILGTSCVGRRNKLEHCGVTPTNELVVEILSRVRNDWETAFTFYLWAGKQEGYSHSVREYHSMISILGKMRKFDTAWTLIDEMRGGKTGVSLVNTQTLMIMIRKYSAVHDVGKAISTFYMLKRYRFSVGVEEFQDLLSALCHYKNVEDAEKLLFSNEKVFPFDTKSFNIVLNGWCNVVVNLGQAKRFWKLMANKGIDRDTISYSSMISCYSKVCNVHEVLKLFNRMRDLDIAPDQKVYNAVIHALAKGKLVKEAIELFKTMEAKGFKPNVATYNSLIKPLCKARRVDDAKMVFDEMLQKGFNPTVRTYHSFFSILPTDEEVFELMEKMKRNKCEPVHDTFIMLIRKFSRWRQIENVFKLWNEMGANGLSPDRSSYIVLIHGLFMNGKLEDAWKYYEEMKEKGFLPERKTEEMLQAYSTAKQAAGEVQLETKYSPTSWFSSTKFASDITRNSNHEKDFLKLPETRKVTREKGFSFWDN